MNRRMMKNFVAPALLMLVAICGLLLSSVTILAPQTKSVDATPWYHGPHDCWFEAKHLHPELWGPWGHDNLPPTSTSPAIIEKIPLHGPIVFGGASVLQYGNTASPPARIQVPFEHTGSGFTVQFSYVMWQYGPAGFPHVGDHRLCPNDGYGTPVSITMTNSMTMVLASGSVPGHNGIGCANYDCIPHEQYFFTISYIPSSNQIHFASHIFGYSSFQMLIYDFELISTDVHAVRFIAPGEATLATLPMPASSPNLTTEQIPEFTGFVPPLYRFAGWRTQSGVWAQPGTAVTSDMDFYPVMVQDFTLGGTLPNSPIYERGEYNRADLARGFSNGIYVLDGSDDALLKTEFQILNRTIPWFVRTRPGLPRETYFVLTLNTRENDLVPTASQFSGTQKQLTLLYDGPGNGQVKLMYDTQELRSWSPALFLREPENNMGWEQNAIDFKLSLEGNRIRWELWYGANRAIRATGLLPGVAYSYDGVHNFLGLTNVQFPHWSLGYTHTWQSGGFLGIGQTTNRLHLPLELPTIRMAGRHTTGHNLSVQLFKVSFRSAHDHSLLGEVNVWGNHTLTTDQIPTAPDVTGWTFDRWANVSTSNLNIASIIQQDTEFWAVYSPVAGATGPGVTGPGTTEPPAPEGGLELWHIAAIMAAGIIVLFVAGVVLRKRNRRTRLRRR